jgi:ubiquinone/menaquinone biosynthesis C-methylase UbiE
MRASAADARPAQAYWNTAANRYEQDFTNTLVGRILRQAVWRDLERVFHPGQQILELNCGTGIDAVHLASLGMRIVACDISSRMIELARQLAGSTEINDRVDFRVLATEEIDALNGEPAFDGAFSNFSGLNCVEDLAATARSLTRLLKPGAPVLVCMIGRFVPWEIAWFLAHGKPGKAFQRLREDRVRSQGGSVTVQRPSVSEITRLFAPGLVLRRWKGIGIGVPPSYMESWASRFPRLMHGLALLDRWLGSFPPFRNMADLVLMEFEAKGTMSEP